MTLECHMRHSMAFCHRRAVLLMSMSQQLQAPSSWDILEFKHGKVLSGTPVS